MSSAVQSGRSGVIFDVREFTVHDGPGVRTTVFLKGCPLRCQWCHNPEGLSPRPQLMVTRTGCTGCGACRVPCAHPECAGLGRCLKACPQGLVRLSGRTVDADALAARLKRHAPLLREGGVTLSGGEPLMQPEFTAALLEALRPLHTIVETSGYAPAEDFRAVAEACDEIYLDVKLFDGARHRACTGVDNARILQNLAWLEERGRPYTVRTPLIPGKTDDAENLTAIARLLRGHTALRGWELLSYNPFAAAKYGAADMTFALGENVPEQKQPPLEALRAMGLNVTVR